MTTKTTTNPAHARIATAAGLVADVLGELNIEYEVCDCCGLKKYEDPEDRKLANRLEGVTKTLENVRAALRRREKGD